MATILFPSGGGTWSSTDDFDVEASQLGLPPGVWPLTIIGSIAEDGEAASRIPVVFHRPTGVPSGDFVAIDYRSPDGYRLKVFND